MPVFFIVFMCPLSITDAIANQHNYSRYAQPNCDIVQVFQSSELGHNKVFEENMASDAHQILRGLITTSGSFRLSRSCFWVDIYYSSDSRLIPSVGAFVTDKTANSIHYFHIVIEIPTNFSVEREELAAILAHELGHVANGDLKRKTRRFLQVVTLGIYRRSYQAMQDRADVFASRTLRRFGIDPWKLKELYDKMMKNDPSPEIERSREALKKILQSK